MASEISSVGSVVQAAIPAVSNVASRITQGEFAPGKEQRVESAVGSRDSAYYSGIGGDHASAQTALDQRLDQAIVAHQTQKALAGAEAILDAAEESLIGIVKRYPPYAPDSPQRIELLNQVTGLRKQIEALEFPPAASEEANQLDPLLQKLLGLGNEVATAIPDEALAALLDKVESAKTLIAEQRAGVWADLFAPETLQSEREAAVQSSASQAALAGVTQPISQAPELLAALA